MARRCGTPHGRQHTDGETAAAGVAGVRALAAGRADLLAEAAGILIGASEATLMQALKHCAADLLIKRVPGPRLVPGWIAERRTRRQLLPPAR